MQKFNLTFLKKILFFSLTIFLVLLSIIISSTIAFKKHFIQNQIINYKTLQLESQILRKEFEISKDTTKITTILKNIKKIRNNNNEYKLNFKFGQNLKKYERLLYLFKINYIYKGLDENSGLQRKFRKVFMI